MVLVLNTDPDVTKRCLDRKRDSVVMETESPRRRWLTVSPGFTDTVTTEPGIGERRMLLVSSGTFSGM